MSFGISQFATDGPLENFLPDIVLVEFELGSFWFRM